MDSGQCKRIEEEKKEQEERIRKAKLAAEERRQKEKSDWVVGLAGDFWGRLESGEDRVELSLPRHGESSSLDLGFATSFEAASTHHGLGIQDDDRDLDQEHADMLRQFLQRPNRFAMAVGQAAADVDDDDDEGDEASDHTVEAGG